MKIAKNSGLPKGLKIRKREEGSPDVDLAAYDTVILDVDSTILVCYDSQGNMIPAFVTNPPYYLDPKSINILSDNEGNIVELESGFLQKVHDLASQGKRMFIVSKSEDKNLSNGEVQPVDAILKAFGIFDFFEDVFVDADANKSDYVKQIQDGDTVFVDDQQKNLEDVSVNTDADVVDPGDGEVFAKYYTRLVMANLDYDSTLKNIQEDRDNAARGIYTERNEDGSVRYKIDTNRGTVGDYVDPAYKSRNPGVHEFRSLDQQEIDRFRRLNKQNIAGYDDRIRALDQYAEPSDVVGVTEIDALSENPSEAQQVMERIGLLQNGEVNLDIAEKLHSYMGDNATSKFFAGVAYEVLDLRDGSPFYQKMASDIAYQIASHELYGSYSGEADYRDRHGLDSVPVTRQELVQPQTLFRSARGREQDVDPGIWNAVKEKANRMNFWVQQGVYEFDDPVNRVFSAAFRATFPEYVQKHEQIRKRTQEILSQVRGVASGLNIGGA